MERQDRPRHLSRFRASQERSAGGVGFLQPLFHDHRNSRPACADRRSASGVDRSEGQSGRGQFRQLYPPRKRGALLASGRSDLDLHLPALLSGSVTEMTMDAQPHIVSCRKLTVIWLALLALTALTVAITRLDLGGYKVLAALVIACVKAGLVIAFFMHMKYEGRLLRGLLFLALVTLAIYIGFTFFDVLYR